MATFLPQSFQVINFCASGGAEREFLVQGTFSLAISNFNFLCKTHLKFSLSTLFVGRSDVHWGTEKQVAKRRRVDNM
jgi:hypothetical protein